MPALIAIWEAESALTTIVPVVPVTLGVPVSVAVIVWLPAVFNFAVKVFVPLSPAAKL